jgi:hypothetical protein
VAVKDGSFRFAAASAGSRFAPWRGIAGPIRGVARVRAGSPVDSSAAEPARGPKAASFSRTSGGSSAAVPSN